LKCWGSNYYAQLGLGDTSNRGDQPGEMGNSLPALDLGAGRTAVMVSVHYAHTCAVLDSGSVKCWGYNGGGELGQGDALDRGDQPGEMGDNLPPVDLGTGRTAKRITGGSWYSCALLDNAMVRCWGANRFGELGLGDTANRGDGPAEMGDNLPAVDFGAGRAAKAIAGSGEHTCVLLDNGAMKCWGYNNYGELGVGDRNHRGDAPGEMGESLRAVRVGTQRTAISISVGRSFTCAGLDNRSSKCWGLNNYGALGLGDTVTRGDDLGEMGDNLPTVDFGVGKTADAISAGAGEHTCALLNDRNVKCWGNNWGGALGLGDTLNRGDEPGEMGDNLPTVQLWGP
jgi:alpha-tubulin suppressor-like RCC1 family protein